MLPTQLNQSRSYYDFKALTFLAALKAEQCKFASRVVPSIAADSTSCERARKDKKKKKQQAESRCSKAVAG